MTDSARDDERVGALVVFVAAAGLLALIATKVRRKQTTQFDRRIRRAMRAHRSVMLDSVARPITVLSLPAVVVGATATLAWWLHRDGRTKAALAVATAPVLGATVGQSFTLFFPQPTAPSVRRAGKKPEASFPSGHTTGLTAEMLSIAFVLQREGLASSPAMAALLGWPFVVGMSRVYRDRHWASDVLAGWIAGTGVAAASALLYEGRRNVTGHSSPPMDKPGR